MTTKNLRVLAIIYSSVFRLINQLFDFRIIDKLASNDTTKNGMLPSASKDISIKFAYQCLHILNKKEILNGIKVSKKIQKRQSLFKYQ